MLKDCSYGYMLSALYKHLVSNDKSHQVFYLVAEWLWVAWFSYLFVIILSFYYFLIDFLIVPLVCYLQKLEKIFAAKHALWYHRHCRTRCHQLVRDPLFWTVNCSSATVAWYRSRIPIYHARFILWPPSLSSPIRTYGKRTTMATLNKNGHAYRYQATVSSAPCSCCWLDPGGSTGSCLRSGSSHWSIAFHGDVTKVFR